MLIEKEIRSLFLMYNQDLHGLMKSAILSIIYLLITKIVLFD